MKLSIIEQVWGNFGVNGQITKNVHQPILAYIQTTVLNAAWMNVHLNVSIQGVPGLRGVVLTHIRHEDILVQ
jgi:hypothetical protein